VRHILQLLFLRLFKWKLISVDFLFISLSKIVNNLNIFGMYVNKTVLRITTPVTDFVTVFRNFVLLIITKFSEGKFVLVERSESGISRPLGRHVDLHQ
jgi:hypothetical protein